MKVCELNSYPWCCWCCEDVVDTGVRSSSWKLSLVASVVMQEEARTRQLHNSISPPCNHTTTHFNPDHRLQKTGNLHIIKLINPDNPQCFQPELVSKKTFNKTFFRTTVAQTLLNNCVIKWVHSREFLENSENIQFTVGHVGTHYFNCCCTKTKYIPLNINCTLSNTKFCRFCIKTKNLIESLKCFLWRGTPRLQWLLQCLIDHQDCHSQHCDLWWSAHYWVLHHSSLSARKTCCCADQRRGLNWWTSSFSGRQQQSRPSIAKVASSSLHYETWCSHGQNQILSRQPLI